MKEGEKKGLVNGPEVLDLPEKVTKIKFGQAILFNPFVLHGNIPFSSKYAVNHSNVRFQSFKNPCYKKILNI